MTSHEFVQTSDEECESTWLSWPKMQEHAIENGTVLIWHMGDSVGHFIRALIYVLPLVHLLEIGLIINFHRLPAFRVAFEPAMVKWDVDPVPFLQIASNSSEGMTSDGKHALAYRRGTFILSDTQLNLLAETMGVEGGDRAAMLSGLEDALGFNWRDALTAVGVKPPPACAWNMLLRRSKYMVSSIEAHSPWHGPLHGIVEAGDMPYSAWHIRTSDGETADSFTAERNVYIFHNQSPADVCPLFISTKETVRSTCPHISDTDGFPMPVFISSNRYYEAFSCFDESQRIPVSAREWRGTAPLEPKTTGSRPDSSTWASLRTILTRGSAKTQIPQ
eukprot:g9388.t1